MGEKMRLSYSKISDFVACPRKFWLSYIKCVPLQSNKYLVAGKEIHELLHKSTFEQDWKTFLLTHPKYAEFKPMVDNYLEYQEALVKAGGNPVPHIAEMKYHDREWDFSLVIDRIDKHRGRKLLLDYKSDSKVDQNKHDMQLLLYAYFYNKIHPHDPITHYGPFFIKQRKGVAAKEITQEKLQEALDWLKKQKTDIESRGLESNKFLPNPNEHCFFCTHQVTGMCVPGRKQCEVKESVEITEHAELN
jgi:CRISPR/Cas system-associated exonuclease Cas4 (RecB family)